MLIKRVCIENAKERKDVLIQDGKFKKIAEDIPEEPGMEVLDGEGKLLLPQFVESHVHLDSALTAGEPRWNLSGTLFEGIACWSERKSTLSKRDVMDRARDTVRRQAKNGIGYVRTHVDVTDPTLVALQGLLELKEELKEEVTIQVVAFPQEGILSYPKAKELMEEAMKMGADAVGGIPHFEFTREYGVESVNVLMNLAEKYDRLVDVHCDEIDDEQSRYIETVATRAYESGMKERVTASHTTSMHSFNNAYASKLFRVLMLSGMNLVANPLVNTHLQGRFDTYPKRRGVTRVKELLAADINVSFGHDDIFDPWYPLGDGNMLDVVHMGLHVCQMMGYEEILNSYRLVTYHGARTLHLGETYGIKEGNPASFILLNGEDFYQVLNEKREVLYNFTKGKLIASSKPAIKEALF